MTVGGDCRHGIGRSAFWPCCALYSDGGDKSFSASLDLDGIYSLSRFVGFGLGIAALALPAQEVQLAAIARGQLPYWGGVAKAYLQILLGLARGIRGEHRNKSGWYHGITVGNEFELTPFSLVYLEIGLAASVGGGLNEDTYSKSSRLQLSAGYGWRF